MAIQIPTAATNGMFRTTCEAVIWTITIVSFFHFCSHYMYQLYNYCCIEIMAVTEAIKA